MFRQRPQPSRSERKFEFLQAILECQIGNPKIDFAKLAERLGYKNERCASDSYYRFCRENLGWGRNQNAKTKNDGKSKQTYRVDGKAITTGKSKDSNGVNNRDDDEGEVSDGSDEDTKVGILKTEDDEMEGLSAQFWNNTRVINLVEPDEWRLRELEDMKVKSEPEIKKERPQEVWVW